MIWLIDVEKWDIKGKDKPNMSDRTLESTTLSQKVSSIEYYLNNAKQMIPFMILSITCCIAFPWIKEETPVIKISTKFTNLMIDRVLLSLYYYFS